MGIKTKAIILVFFQITCIAVLFLSSLQFYKNILALVIFMIGLFLGILAVYAMSKSKIKINPIPHEKAFLMTKGIYQSIRHPMYTGVLLCCLGFCLNEPTNWKWAIYLLLIVTLLLKINFEEKLLMERFTEYSTYQKQTKKLIPFVY